MTLLAWRFTDDDHEGACSNEGCVCWQPRFSLPCERYLTDHYLPPGIPGTRWPCLRCGWHLCRHDHPVSEGEHS